MAVRSVSDLMYTLIARLPIIAIVVVSAWILMQGAVKLEEYSWGTEFFVSNAATDNRPPGLGASDADVLANALATGDVAQMEAALDQVERAQAARHGGSASVGIG
jgi:hypothetical protein